MGIGDLYKLIENKASNAIGRVPITHYAGKMIAVDGHNWMYRYMYGARNISAGKTNFATETVDNRQTRQEWLILCLNFIIKWLSFKVTPIFVMDGPDKPAKGDTMAERSKAHNKKKESFREKLEQLNSLDVLDRSEEMIGELKKDFTKFIDLDSDDVSHLISILDRIGLPWLKATGEAEQLCTMLALEGKVEAVFSKDGDNLTLGCPVLLKDFGDVIYEDGVSVPTLIYYELSIILDELELTMEQFVDLCILLGCDYNSRLKGYGPVNALKAIKNYGSINDLAKDKDITCLNYAECIVNFKRVDSEEITLEGNLSLREPDAFLIRETLEANNVSKLSARLSNAIAETYYYNKELEKKRAKKRIVKIKKKVVKVNEGKDKKVAQPDEIKREGKRERKEVA
jgi:flap endonuclease-1